MRSDLCLPLKVRLWTIQLTLSLSLTRAFMRMGCWRWCHLYTACMSYPRNFKKFQLTKLSLSIYYVPANVLNAVKIRQGGWLGGPFAKTPEVGPVRHLEVWHVWIPSLAAFITTDLLPEDLEPGCDWWAPVILMTLSWTISPALR